MKVMKSKDIKRWNSLITINSKKKKEMKGKNNNNKRLKCEYK